MWNVRLKWLFPLQLNGEGGWDLGGFVSPFQYVLVPPRQASVRMCICIGCSMCSRQGSFSDSHCITRYVCFRACITQGDACCKPSYSGKTEGTWTDSAGQESQTNVYVLWLLYRKRSTRLPKPSSSRRRTSCMSEPCSSRV